MPAGQYISCKTASRLDRARRLLRAQLEALVCLAAVALRMIELAAPQIAVDPHRPLAGVAALERAVRNHARISWALRLIWALRAKLVGDLVRVERGEGVDEVLAAEARASVAAAAELDDDDDGDEGPERGETLRESEGMERESFGRYVSRRSGEAEFAEILKRPTREVIALIREALGLSPAPSEDPLGSRLEDGRPGSVVRFIAPPPPPPGPGLRSPCPV